MEQKSDITKSHFKHFKAWLMKQEISYYNTIWFDSITLLETSFGSDKNCELKAAKDILMTGNKNDYKSQTWNFSCMGGKNGVWDNKR